MKAFFTFAPRLVLMKIMSLALAVMMVLGVATAMAASVTISPADGEQLL